MTRSGCNASDQAKWSSKWSSKWNLSKCVPKVKKLSKKGIHLSQIFLFSQWAKSPKKTVWRNAFLLIAMLSKIHSYWLFFRWFCTLGYLFAMSKYWLQRSFFFAFVNPFNVIKKCLIGKDCNSTLRTKERLRWKTILTFCISPKM